jgi:hypothetical protein
MAEMSAFILLGAHCCTSLFVWVEISLRRAWIESILPVFKRFLRFSALNFSIYICETYLRCIVLKYAVLCAESPSDFLPRKGAIKIE